MTLLDGKELSKKLREVIKLDVLAMKRKPTLAVIMVGSDGASDIYVRNKERACQEVGINSITERLPEDTSQEELLSVISRYSSDSSIDGILVQLPLPRHIDTRAVINSIPADKDVDGFSFINTGKLFNGGVDCPVSCTPIGIIALFTWYGIPLDGKNVVILGRSNEVGKPLIHLFLEKNATVTCCHSRTENLKEICSRADVLVSAIGKPRFVTADYIKDGAVVIDVGINRDENGKLCGDVDFDNVKDKVSYITPVPGGVGPMTVTMLLVNTKELTKKHIEEEEYECGKKSQSN